ncbi:MAG: hypothetical protein JNJ54_18325 [Myxococcaceae bacterium]|nr:hypothetical protein [Myxococcaceae bacterium]
MRAVLTAGLLLCGCSGLTRAVKPPPQPLQLTTVFVYPVTLNGMPPSPPRVFELSVRALNRAVQEGGDTLAFYGPTEFKVLKPEVDSAWVATDAIPLLVGSGSRPDQGAALRLVVERRIASSSTQTESAKGQTRGASSNEETTWLVRGELLHPSSVTTLIEVSGQVTVDPFATPPPEAEWDPAPQLTALIERIVTEATRHAVSHAANRTSAPRTTALFAPTPATAEWFPQGASDAEGDALQREIQLQNKARLLAPGATEAQAATLARAVAGTAVLEGDGKLQPGDVVLKVDQLPALPHVLARVRFKGAPAELEVKRATGATEAVVWP